jgi:hypothetical protein
VSVPQCPPGSKLYILTRRSDLISYKVGKKEPLHVDEVVAGTGSSSPVLSGAREHEKLTHRMAGELCGSVFLDRRFEDYIRRMLGDKFISDMKVFSLRYHHMYHRGSLLIIVQPERKAEMMRSWEEMVKNKVRAPPRNRHPLR